MNKKILDACCSGRMFWFNKQHEHALYMDIREPAEFTTGEGKHKRTRSVNPDVVSDFRDMPFGDETFKLVVFDPPHLFVGEKSYMGQIYGRLDRRSWKHDLSQGFSECFRVLQRDGVLIFKWNETDIPLKTILELTDYEPLFGHPSGKSQKTHWVTFMKL